MQPEHFGQIAISLVLGLLIGLQRERTERTIGGIRTFPLIAAFGTLCGWLAGEYGGWIVAAGVTLAAWMWRGRNARVAAICLLLPAVLVGAELTIAARHSFARGVTTANAPETATSDALDSPAVQARFKTLGVTMIAPDRRSPEYLNQFVKTEGERWGSAIKASGVQIE